MGKSRLGGRMGRKEDVGEEDLGGEVGEEGR